MRSPLLWTRPRARVAALCVLILAAVFASCTGHDGSPQDATLQTTQPAKVAPAPDPGPQLSRAEGALKPVKVAEAPTVTVLGVQRDKDAVFVELSVSKPPQPEGYFMTLTDLRAASDGAHAQAVLLNATGGPAQSLGWSTPTAQRVVPPPGPDGALPIAASAERLLVRVVGPKADALTVEQRWMRVVDEQASPPTPLHRAFTVEAAQLAKAPKGADLKARFFQGAAMYLRWRDTAHTRWFQSDEAVAYLASRLEDLGAQAAPRQRGVPVTRPTRRSDIGEMMALYTGATAVEEALQADRGLRVRDAETPQQRTVPVSALPTVELAQHPWASMIADAATRGVVPVVEPLAAAVPHDVIYLHAFDLRELLALARELDAWAAPVALATEDRLGDARVLARVEDQLALERTKASELFGHLAVQGVAIALGDPFLREGTDVSVVFHLRNRDAVLTIVDGFDAGARARRPDVTVAQETLDGVPVRVLSTPDRRIHQLRLELGDRLILTNSRAAAQRLIDVHKGRLTALKDAQDFQYMRALYPARAEDESALLFVGDAVVARAVSPRTRILHARRLQAQADLRAVGYAALLHGWLQGSAAPDGEALLASGALYDGGLTHALGDNPRQKEPLQFDPKRGAWSKTWGSAGLMTPLLDRLDTLDKVTPAERDAYALFRDTYQSYWRDFIDPIAVRVRRRDGGARFELDGRMLPLVEQSAYNQLIRMVGQADVSLPNLSSGGVQFTFAVGQDAPIRRELDAMARSTPAPEALTARWLGDWVMAGSADRSGLWDMLLAFDAIPSWTRYQERTGGGFFGALPPARVFNRLPVYLGAHVRDGAALTAMLDAIRKDTPDLPWAQDGAYRDVPVHTITLGELEGDDEPLTLHYAIAGEVFALSLNRPTLETVIDAALDDRMPGGASASAVRAQAGLTVAPSGEGVSWLSRAVLGVIEDRVQHTVPRVAWRWALLDAVGDADDPELAAGLLGYTPRTPHNGRFARRADGAVVHSVYGADDAPNIPPLPVSGSALSDLLGMLRVLDLSVAFEKHGSGELGKTAHRGLRVRAAWTRGAKAAR